MILAIQIIFAVSAALIMIGGTGIIAEGLSSENSIAKIMVMLEVIMLGICAVSLWMPPVNVKNICILASITSFIATWTFLYCAIRFQRAALVKQMIVVLIAMFASINMYSIALMTLKDLV